MARKATPAASTSAIDSHAGDLAVADAVRHGQLITERERGLADVERRFGLDLPYDYDRYVGIARDAVDGISHRAFVIGRALIQIKEHEPHGRFLPALEEIGVSPRFAQQCMATVLKFEGSDAKRLVASRLSQRKLLDLLVESDEAIEALAEGGTLAGFTLDKIDSMSTRELREALRKERQEAKDELAARDDIIARKDEKLHKLELKSRRAAKTPLREQGDDLMKVVLDRIGELISVGDGLKLAIDELQALYVDAGEDLPPEFAEQLANAVGTAERITDDLRDASA